MRYLPINPYFYSYNFYIFLMSNDVYFKFYIIYNGDIENGIVGTLHNFNIYINSIIRYLYYLKYRVIHYFTKLMASCSPSSSASNQS